MKLRSHCSGCGHDQLTGEFRLSRQPVVLNYRFARPSRAARVPRRDIVLRQCQRCGLIFNAAFEAELIPYDRNYENRQCFSPVFQGHLQTLATGLTRRYRLRQGRILEVGCGKGDFLRLLCRTAEAVGVGFDTSYEPGSGPESVDLQFFSRYLSATDVPGRFDAVICRHVVEHVGEIGSFLREIRDIAAAAGTPVVVIETPRFEWIAREHAIWDIVYEHCNYFPSHTLRYLCRLAGLDVRRQSAVFGGQYQIIELQLAEQSRRTPRAPGIAKGASLALFARQADTHLAKLTRRVLNRAAGRPWAIWGAGAKGVALANLLPATKPAFVVDANPQKQGGIIPGTRVPIISPEDRRLDAIGLILIANPNYAKEIGASLRARAFRGAVEIL
ncbi:MAG TPA: class I SAM-dependent methyltransferase [Verrucomicrobiota bacterium]|nr:hypothetical protein [Verrucomicrobiales bacterium]HRI12255.1 class I SAM-dependent methyltransferase [Verrucomicrobiota bacterium]